MKKNGILHNELARVIASLGHGQLLVVGDAGLPVPRGVRCIDLAVTAGVPTFVEVLRAVLGEMQVERAVLATETGLRSPHVAAAVRELLGSTPIQQMAHDELKAASVDAVAVVRTGEFTPYANVLLYAGVVF
jgi:D-ribose pyranase